MNNLTKSGKALSQMIDLLLGVNFTRPIEKEMLSMSGPNIPKNRRLCNKPLPIAQEGE